MRRKLFTAINLLCIVLTLVVLMVVTALLENAFFPRGVEGKSERFLQVFVLDAKGPHTSINSPLGYKLIEKYLKPMKSVEMVSAAGLPRTVSVYQQGRVSELEMRMTDAEYWKILDFRVLAGRVINADDVAQGRFVAVINASTARRLFPAPPRWRWARRSASAASLRDHRRGRRRDAHQRLRRHLDAVHHRAVVRLPAAVQRRIHRPAAGEKPADLPQVRQEVEQIASTVQFDDPNKITEVQLWADNKLDMFARNIMAARDADSGAGRLLAIIGSAMLLFMVLPALNLVNLNTGRIMERRSEIGVRKAFGATSAQLVWQLIVENMLLCVAGGLLGLAAAGVLWWLEGSGLIPYLKVDMNFAIFGYGLLLSLIFGLMSGVIPAWKMSRLDPVHALKGNA